MIVFTGIVQAVGSVQERSPSDAGARLLLESCGWSHRPAPGQSVAVMGCCLTHAPGPGDAQTLLCFDVVEETLAKTRLGTLAAGDRVNLEAPVTAGSPIGGHFVQGHIDGLAKVLGVGSDGEQHVLTLEADASLFRYIPPGGSIALDGVSLTLAAVDAAKRQFAVALIPTTLQTTTLGDLQPGDAVHMETDMLVKAAVWAASLEA